MDLAQAVTNESDDLSAVKDLFTDVERIQSEGYQPLLFSEEGQGISEALDQYDGRFPVIVHYFILDKDTEIEREVHRRLASNQSIDSDLLQKIHREHTFLVLGEAEEGYVCFQKSGPKPSEPMIICHLDLIDSEARNNENRYRLAFFGPAV